MKKTFFLLVLFCSFYISNAQIKTAQIIPTDIQIKNVSNSQVTVECSQDDIKWDTKVLKNNYGVEAKAANGYFLVKVWQPNSTTPKKYKLPAGFRYVIKYKADELIIMYAEANN